MIELMLQGFNYSRLSFPFFVPILFVIHLVEGLNYLIQSRFDLILKFLTDVLLIFDCLMLTDLVSPPTLAEVSLCQTIRKY
jgi:hypothetical protein